MSKRIPGLQYNKKNGEWSIDKRIRGHGRVRQRLRASTQEEAEIEFHHKISAIYNSVNRQNEGQMTFREAALKYIRDSNKRSLDRDVNSLKCLDSFIGHYLLSDIHQGTLQPYIDARRTAGIKSGTVQRDLAVVRRILSLASRSWRNNKGQPFLSCPPLLEMPDWEDSAIPYPLDWKEQRRLLQALPEHLKKMALFAVNTGLREQGVCWLRWDWEVEIPEFETSVFITPGRPCQYSDGTWPGEKNKEDQMVVLNRIAKKIIALQRKNRIEGCDYVFPYKGRRLGKINNTAWQNAWKKAGLPTHKDYNRGPHNLKHTFGRRLRNAGVPLETRKTLLHHTNRDITTHYSPAELKELIESVEKVVQLKPCTFLRRKSTK